VNDLETLCTGPLAWFRDWPNLAVPADTPGVYTIWAIDRLVYVGIAVRSLRGRLASHASGKRGGDQFCVYVADRFVLPAFTPDDIKAISSRKVSFDALVRRYIHEHFGYRWIAVADALAARQLEKAIRTGALPVGLPLLNPKVLPGQRGAPNSVADIRPPRARLP
jgi:hypothetical protein